MRVLFVSNLYPPNVVGGYERLCFTVATAFRDRGHDVSVLTSAGPGTTAEDVIPGQRVLRTLRLLTGATIYQPFAGDAGARDTVNRANLAALDDALRSERPDIVFSWNLFFLDRGLLDVLAAAPVPVVAMLTDNWLANMIRPDYVAAFFRDHVFGDRPFPPPAPLASVPPPRPRRIQALLRRIRSSSVPLEPGKAASPLAPPVDLGIDAIFGAEFMRTFYREAGFRFRRERVVHNGVHQDVPPDAAFPDRTVWRTPGRFRILFAGRLVDLKGADTAVRALPLIDAARIGGARAELTLLGDTQDEAYMTTLHALIAGSAAADRIELRPPVAADHLFDLFAAYDAYVFPSLYEPFSLTLIHALACGIPTAASRAGGNVEIVADDVSGLLFDRHDAAELARALERLGADGALRARLSREGRAAAARFTFDSMVEAMEGFLGDVVGAA